MPHTITSLRIMTPNLGVREKLFVFQYWNGHIYVNVLLKGKVDTALKALCGGQSSLTFQESTYTNPRVIEG